MSLCGAVRKGIPRGMADSGGLDPEAPTKGSGRASSGAYALDSRLKQQAAHSVLYHASTPLSSHEVTSYDAVQLLAVGSHKFRAPHFSTSK